MWWLETKSRVCQISVRFEVQKIGRTYDVHTDRGHVEKEDQQCDDPTTSYCERPEGRKCCTGSVHFSRVNTSKLTSPYGDLRQSYSE